MVLERGMGVAKRQDMQCTCVPLRFPLVMVLLADCTAGKLYVVIHGCVHCFAAVILLPF